MNFSIITASSAFFPLSALSNGFSAAKVVLEYDPEVLNLLKPDGAWAVDADKGTLSYCDTEGCPRSPVQHGESGEAYWTLGTFNFTVNTVYGTDPKNLTKTTGLTVKEAYISEDFSDGWDADPDNKLESITACSLNVQMELRSDDPTPDDPTSADPISVDVIPQQGLVYRGIQQELLDHSDSGYFRVWDNVKQTAISDASIEFAVTEQRLAQCLSHLQIRKLQLAVGRRRNAAVVHLRQTLVFVSTFGEPGIPRADTP